jgi:hypothetical protein
MQRNLMITPALEKVSKAIGSQAALSGTAGLSWEKFKEAVKGALDTQKQSAAASERQALGLAANATQAQVDAAKIRADTLATLQNTAAKLAAAGGFLGIRGAMLSTEQAQLSLIQAQKTYNQDLKEHHGQTLQGRQDLLALRQAQLATVQSQENLKSTAVSWAQQEMNAGESTRAVIAQVTDFGKKAGLTKGQVDDLVASVLAYVNGLKDIPALVKTNVVLDYSNRYTGRAHPSQHGFHGWVDRPTLFLAGEGPNPRERVDITPAGRSSPGRGGGGMVNHFHFNAPIYGVDGLRREVERTVVEVLRPLAT